MGVHTTSSTSAQIVTLTCLSIFNIAVKSKFFKSGYSKKNNKQKKERNKDIIKSQAAKNQNDIIAKFKSTHNKKSIQHTARTINLAYHKKMWWVHTAH